MNSSVFEGGCLCGNTRYRSTSAPVRGVICHCAMCRKHSGAPALAFFHFPAGSFTWVRGEPAWYRSSPHAARGFCRDCGSILAMREDVLADRVQVTAGSLDHPERVRPDDHVWCADALPWFSVDDDLPRHTRSSPAVPTRAEE